ncbi:MAG TPA: serine/threonine-protein kinase, partial [Longimicrobiales bacterium]|nr:serine/threonine-protein kinase [Longimicrobiales bacterium]
MSTGEARCQKCDTPVTADSLFCSKCGADVTGVHGAEAETLAATAIGTPAPRIQSTMRQILRDATLGEYEILSELGRGGMATVFLAHDISLDRKVAIKVMAPHLLEGEGMAERFKLEARTAAQLSHPHIIPIYAVKETESTLYFVMKFVEGKPLDDIIKKMGQLPVPMVKDILTKVGSALGYAHRRGVVHRDVKPGNVMIDEEGTPIVTDFGIAKVAEAKGLTMTGTTIGTPAYMSPEQCEAKEVTGASDQYSLGVVAWEMLTGQTPFAGDSAVTTMYKHCHEPLPPLQDFRPDCPPELLETVTRMLAKAPSDRWPSLEATIRKLGSTTQDQLDPIRRELLELARETDPRELIAQLSTPRSPLPGVGTAARTAAGAAAGAASTPVPAPTRRSWFPVGAAAAVLIAVAGGAVAVLQQWGSGAPPA